MASMRRPIAMIFGLAALAMTSPSTAAAAQCGGNFDAFLAEFAREAQAQQISQQTISTAFEGLTPDPRVIQLDRRQGVFKQTFEQFGPPRVMLLSLSRVTTRGSGIRTISRSLNRSQRS